MQLTRALQILDEIRTDVAKHNRSYIGRVKRQDAIEALAGACICLSAIIRYNEEKADNESESN